MRVFVAGHSGMVGSAVKDQFLRIGAEVISRERAQLDLSDQSAVESFFKRERPQIVVLAAAKVGGISANNSQPADFILQNLQIQTNVVNSAFRADVEQLLFLGSSCIYPRLSDQPIREDALLTGPLEPTNEPYAIAKIAGIKLCESLNRQYGTDFRSLMPTNLYGPGDNFHPTNSHVLPALIRRFHEAKVSGLERVVIWGSGTPRREFLHVSDLAEASLFVISQPKDVFNAHTDLTATHINVGLGRDVSIRELAFLIKRIVGFTGQVVFDTTKPDGTPRKLLDVSKLTAMGWVAKISLEEGLEATYRWFVENQNILRKF